MVVTRIARHAASSRQELVDAKLLSALPFLVTALTHACH